MRVRWSMPRRWYVVSVLVMWCVDVFYSMTRIRMRCRRRLILLSMVRSIGISLGMALVGVNGGSSGW